ncbi:MAG: hypothetical protein KJ070_07715 [Verrucomicrobia bacterium]|nr:hypothetical protein [Verrucomicrobiota bacterium]
MQRIAGAGIRQFFLRLTKLPVGLRASPTPVHLPLASVSAPLTESGKAGFDGGVETDTRGACAPRFICVVSVGSACGNFSKANRGILVTTQSMLGSKLAGIRV